MRVLKNILICFGNPQSFISSKYVLISFQRRFSSPSQQCTPPYTFIPCLWPNSLPSVQTLLPTTSFFCYFRENKLDHIVTLNRGKVEEIDLEMNKVTLSKLKVFLSSHCPCIDENNFYSPHFYTGGHHYIRMDGTYPS